MTDEVLFEGGAPGGTYTAFNTANFAGAGPSLTTLYSLAQSTFSFTAGQVTAFAPVIGVSFTASVMSSALSSYHTGLPPGFEVADLFLGFSLKDASGHVIGASDAQSAFSGQLVANYSYIQVPEPATVLISCIGLVVLWGARRTLTLQA